MTHKNTLAKIGDAIDNDGMVRRIDGLIDLLHVALCLSGNLSNEFHSLHLDYLNSARSSLDQMEDKKWSRQYAKDAEIFAKAADDLQKLRSKLAKKLDR